MRKISVILGCLLGLCACDKHDPILPGVRTAIFDTSNIQVQNKDITDIPQVAHTTDNSQCKYTQDASNVIWDGERKIFSGFATSNTVATNTRPICSGKYLYAGLTTGEVIKIDPKTRQIMWIADVYRTSNLTGGASVVDIIAPIIPYGNAVYAGGLGNAFCKIAATSGDKKWCLDIGVAVPFIIAGNYAFVAGTDNNLYAISTNDGTVFWRSEIIDQVAPIYEIGRITVGTETFNVQNGKKILDK